MNIIVVDAAPVSRTYFVGDWDADNPGPPTCWSPDSKEPSPDVPDENKQNDKCATCLMNLKGSGKNDARACRFGQRLAVAIEGDLDTIYRLHVPAQSIFGNKPENKKMPLQAYVQTLCEYEIAINMVVTEMSFDENSESPRLFWRPVRPLNMEEIFKVSELMDTDEVKQCLEFTVTKHDVAEKALSKDEE